VERRVRREAHARCGRGPTGNDRRKRRHRARGPTSLRLFAAADTWYKWALYDRDPIPQWTRGRVTVLGDAAHPMLPYLGQGACQAIEDGAVLATALSAEAADPLTGLARYERTRRPRANRVVLAARERGLSNLLTSPWAA
jgi:2-polyprenyl-6-methoxyphenol hydroxylase-like FAD-dependent oxidoreductase